MFAGARGVGREAAARDGSAGRDRPERAVAAAPAVLPAQVPAAPRGPRLRHVLHSGGEGDLHGRRMHPGAARPRRRPCRRRPRASARSRPASARSPWTTGRGPTAQALRSCSTRSPPHCPRPPCGRAATPRSSPGSAEVTPWSLGGASWMVYYPRYHALSRDGRWFHAGADVDRLVRGPAAASGGGGHGWPVAAAAVVVARRRGGRRPEAAEAGDRLIRGGRRPCRVPSLPR